MSDPDTAKYEPVAKTTMTLTMIHPVGLKPNEMSDDDVAYHLGDGEFVGARTACETVLLADADVEAELEKIGGNPESFVKSKDVDPATASR